MARCSGQASAGRESWAPSWTQIAYSKELLASFSAVGPGVNLLGHPAVHTYNRAKAVQIRVRAHAHAHKHIVLCPHTHKVFTGKGPRSTPSCQNSLASGMLRRANTPSSQFEFSKPLSPTHPVPSSMTPLPAGLSCQKHKGRGPNSGEGRRSHMYPSLHHGCPG